MVYRVSFGVVIAASLLLRASLGVGQTPTQPASAVAPTQRSIVESMKRSIVFLQTDCPTLDEQGKPVLDAKGRRSRSLIPVRRSFWHYPIRGSARETSVIW
jgi:hypothetical protein